jgi:tetratricopeptide (TPR) repeat protein
MRKILFLYTIALFSLLSVQAQDAGSAYKRANQQYVLFESERDKGANANSMYTYLLEAYNNFIQVTKEQNNVSYINGTKNRLRSMYPYLLNAALYYYEQKETFKALDFASAYIDIRYMPMFRSELLPKDDRYNSVVYFAAVSAFNMKKLDVAKRYFNIYLESGDSTQEKDCFVYLNMIYMSQKNYAEQENILEKAISKYPVSLDFLYNRVNVHIATNNMPKLLNTIDRILTIDPNMLCQD